MADDARTGAYCWLSALAKTRQAIRAGVIAFDTLIDVPLKFQPKPRSVVFCDFNGFIAPEMIKRRPVVVLASHKRNSRLVAIVPLSTTRPEPIEEHHYRLLQNPISDPRISEVWAKCDMVAVVSTERLDLIQTGRRLPNGKRLSTGVQYGPASGVQL